MFRSVISFVFALAIVVLAAAGCQNANPKPQNQALFSKIDSAIAHIQPQTDTGSNPYILYKKSLDSLEKIAIKANYPNALSRIYFMIGSMNRWQNRFDTALVWLEKSYREVKGTNALEEVNTLLEIGDIYLVTGRKRLANDYYYSAKHISENLNSNEATGKTLFRLASAFYHQNSFREALKMYYKTLLHNRETRYTGDHGTLEMRMLNNIGVCYYKLSVYDSALMYYDSALMEANHLDTTPLTIAKGVFLGNKGRIYQLKGDYKKAVKLLTTNTIINARPNGDNRDVITSFLYLGEIYNTLDSNKKFEAVTDSALKYSNIVKSNDVLVWRARIFGLKADYHAKLKNNGLAYENRTRQFAIKDSIERAEEKEDLMDVILYRELKESENKLLSLKKENKLKEARIAIYLTLAIAVIILLIISIVALYSNRKNLTKQKALNKQISEQNVQIQLNKTELEQAIEELKLLNLEKNRLLGMVAHDLRGPIYNITGVVQLLESSPQYKQLDEANAQLVDLIKKSCDNALDVINDLLDAAKLDNDGLDGEQKEEPLNEIIKDVVRLYQSRAQQKNITINYTPPQQLTTALVSKEKINRAIGNLLSNAIKFSHANATVNIVLTTADNHAIISVSDNGMGIPQADREIIFDKFTKAKRPGTAGEKPVGLGMSIVKQIVEAHNGKIWLESEVGAGTTFYIELPLN